jgi:uncharacterized protein with PIN domain
MMEKIPCQQQKQSQAQPPHPREGWWQGTGWGRMLEVLSSQLTQEALGGPFLHSHT